MRHSTLLALVPAASAASSWLQMPWLPRQEAAPADPFFYDPLPEPDVPEDEYWADLAAEDDRKLCIVNPDADGGDDAPAILQALNEDCRQHSLVVLPGPLYNIKSNMTTMNLDDVLIHHYGRLLWTTDIDYWRSVSMPVNFQNQSTVWYFGGDSVVWDGHGFGTLDGNGQVWYDWAQGQGNLPRRPMNINYVGFNNSVVRNLRYVQSQMWTMAVTYSQNLEFHDIYINNTSNSTHSTLNTDGIDTVYSNNITLRRWNVTSGDDHVALKGNSSNISVYDSTFYGGQGLAIGSMGQFVDQWEYIENFHAKNITMYRASHVTYLKTWSGNQNGYPPNGGGGGKGYARNIVMEDIKWYEGRSRPFFAWQCEHYEGDSGKNCNTSEFQIRDVVWRGVKGYSRPIVIHSLFFQCSIEAGGCQNVTIEDYDIRKGQNGPLLSKWHCENVVDPVGWECGAW